MHEALKRYLISAPYGLFAASAVLWCFLFPVAKAPSNIAAVVITISAVLTAFSSTNKTLPPYQNKAAIACSLLLLMPLLWLVHPGPSDYGAYVKDSLFCLYMLAMSYWIRQYPARIHTAIYGLLLGTVVTAAVSLLQHFHALPTKEPGLALGLHNGTLTGAFSLLLVFTCGVLSSLLKKCNRVNSKLFIFTGLLLCLSDLLLVVPGRTGYVAFLALSGFVLFNLYRESRLLTVGALVIVVVLVMNSSVFWQRVSAGHADLAKYSAGVMTTSLGERFEMWKVSWRNFSEHPLFGAGTNGFAVRWMDEGYPKVPEKFNNPHSTYFHILGNYGLAGLGILLFFIWRMAVVAWRNRASLVGVTVGCFLVIFLVGSLTNTMVTSDFYLTWLAIVGGIAGGADMVE